MVRRGSKGNSNPRRGDSSGSSGKWTSGHNGANEDKRTGYKAAPNKDKGNTNKGKEKR